VALFLGDFDRNRTIASVSSGSSPSKSGFCPTILRRLTLLCTVSTIAIGAGTPGHAGQLPVTAFQTYDPNAAANIQPGHFSLFEVPVDSLHPTQLNEGLTEVGKKVTGFDLLAPSQLQSNLLTDIEPVVIGPGGQLYLTDGHHTFTALLNSTYGGSNPTVFVNVIANYSNLTMSQFFQTLQSQNLLLPLNDGVPEAVNTATGAPIPSSLTALTSDPYRGLEYSILKNKSSKLFPSTTNITGAVGASTPGLDKMTGFYSDFLEAAAYRNANGGVGLPFLSPGDIAIATKWNLTKTNAAAATTSLPNVAGPVFAAQLPGFILSNSITVNSVISNSTLAGGALDGFGTFTGITTINAGTASAPITIGTPNVGFIMQLGSDNSGNTVTLGGANSYTGGTSILAGDLIIAGDSSLGAAVPAGATIDPNNIRASVQAANGIIFNSLSEGNGTLTLGTTDGGGTATFSTARPIAVDGETAIININGYLTTLSGQIVSLGSNGVGLGNATGVSDLTIDDTSASQKGVLTLSTASPDFYGNIIIGLNGAPTVLVMNDAALGNTTGVAASIGEVELNGGTLRAGASFAAPERNLFLGGGSNFDVNGFSTSWGNLTDVQRTLEILNGNTTTAGAVTFNSLTIGSTATLQFAGGAAGETVTLTNGIVRAPGGTLILQPTTSTSLGTATEKLFSGAGTASLVNTATDAIAPVYIVTNNGVSKGAGPYDFVTYGSNGYVKATYNASALSNAPGSVVALSANATAGGNIAAFALNTEGKTISLGTNTLTLGDGSNAAGLILASGSAINGGTLAFGGSEGVIWLSGTNPTISSAITGTNGLTFAGSGAVALSTAANVSGAITIDSGTVTLAGANIFASNSGGILLGDVKKSPAKATLAISANNTLATLNSVGNNSVVNISGGAALTIGDANNLSSTLSATITETGALTAGALTKNGTGMLDLSGATVSLVTGSTVLVNGGVLRIANGVFGASATNVFTLASGTELQYAGNGGSKFNDPIQGSGIFHLIGGTVQLTNTNNTYSGGTVVEQGSTLDLTTANVSSYGGGTANGNIANAGGLVVFDQTTTGPTYTGVISDARQMQAATGPLLSGSLVKDDSTGNNGGNLILGAVQAYSGGTFVEAGTLTLHVADAVASSSGVDLGRVGGPSGTGAAAAGPATATLALDANNTIAGLMSERGNNTAVLLSFNTLTINPSANTVWTFGGVISGPGSLVKGGAGNEILTGNSSYTGTTTVNAGALIVGLDGISGSIASSSQITVNAGGTLDGNGIVGNTLINGGTLAPGNSIGTLTVQRDLVFTAAASYLVEISATANDRTNVTGTATLAGTVVAVPQNSFSFGSAATILHADNGLSGQFASVVSGNPLIAAALSYTSNEALLTLSPNLLPFAGPSATQQNVAAALQNAFKSGNPGAFSALFNLPPGALPGALTQLSGETATGSQQTTFEAMTQFLGTLLDPFIDGRGTSSTSASSPPAFAEQGDAADAYASTGRKRGGSERDAYGMITKAVPRAPVFDPRWSVWAAGFGGSQTTDGNAAAGSNSSTSRLGAVGVGADYWLSPNTVAGFALAGGGTQFSVTNGGTGRSDLFQAGAFVKHTQGAAYLAGALAYGWQDIATNRTVTIAGVDQLQARFNANAFSGRLEGGYRFVPPWAGGVGLTPYAAAQFTSFDLPAYAEQAVSGSNAFALNYAAKTVTATRSEWGLRADKSYALADGILSLRSRFAWAHDFNSDRTVSATFQTLPGASFVVNGAAQAHDAALTTASAEMKWLNGISVAATFEGEFSDVTRSYAGKGVVRYQW
jgi:autotransporter-associated beta strand protein